MSSVLVIVDLQNDFCDGVLGNKEVGKAMESISRYVLTNKGNYTHYLFTLDTHERESYNEPFPIHCLKNSHGWHLISPLSRFQNKQGDEYIPHPDICRNIAFVEKSAYGAKEEDLLNSIPSDVKTIHLIGTATEYCVLENYKLLKKLFPNAEVAVIDDYCVGIDYEKSKEALKQMNTISIRFDPETLYQNLIQFIRDRFKNEFGFNTKAVIGVSGGKDSSVCLKLLVDALGWDKVIPVLIPNGTQNDIACSYKICEFCDVRPVEVNIGAAYEALSKEIGEKLNTPNLPSTYTTNTPARLRMTVLYGIAAIKGGIVINTCNLSEDYVGYSTKFGDSAGDLSLLSQLTCSEVIRLGEWMKIPDELIHKAPSDGMCGKTDEDNLGFTYDMLDFHIRHKSLIPEEVEKMIEKKHNHGATKHKAKLILDENVFHV